jgi:hypothetical protein
LGCAGLTVLMLVTPAAGERRAEDVAADCEEASMNTPPSGPGNVKLTADIDDGATVSPGDDILLRLTWDPEDWAGPQLDRALACVRVKGGLDPDLSAEEQPTDNDGVFEYRLHVPDDIRPDCDICVQAFIAGQTGDCCHQQVRSERQCFMSGPPEPEGPPTPPVAEPPAMRPTPPAAEPVRTPTEVPPEVKAVTATAPEPTPAPAVNPAPAANPDAELPRTGATGTRPGSAGGGLALTLGGLAVIGGAGRRRRRPTEV